MGTADSCGWRKSSAQLYLQLGGERRVRSKVDVLLQDYRRASLTISQELLAAHTILYLQAVIEGNDCKNDEVQENSELPALSDRGTEVLGKKLGGVSTEWRKE